MIDTPEILDAPDAEADAATKTEAILKARRFDPTVEPPVDRAIFTLNGIDVATPGNLLAIYAQAKAGKSAVIGAMQACIMAAQRDADCFGFKSSNSDSRAVLSFDTEQSKADHWRHVHRTLKRAGLASPPPWFHAFFFAGLDLCQLLDCIRREIDIVKKEHGGIHSIFLDGAGDCVSNVNDAAESNAFVARLHGLAIEHVCGIVPALHYNPASDGKARGHLGSQLERKAETNLRLDKDADGITEIWSDKNRKAPIPKGKGPCFKWSEAEQMHVSTTSKATTTEGIEREKLTALAEELFSEHPARRFSELQNAIQKALKVAESTAYRKLTLGVKLGVFQKSVAGLYTRGS
jgi:hypothetical protein